MKRKSWITVLAVCLVAAICGLLGACGGTKAVKHSVTVAEGTGYTVSGLDETGYEEGANVTFTITVTDETKEIASVTSDDADVQAKGNGAYGFTMPAKDVTVTVSLTDKEPEPPAKYTVSVSSGAGYTVSGLEEAGYEAGANVTFTVTVTDETKTINSVTSTDVAIQKQGGGTYSFTMPAKNVAINVTLKDSRCTVTFDKNAPAGATVTGTVEAITVEDGQSIIVPDGNYTAEGWMFAGWATAPDGKADLTQGDLRVGQQYTPASSITLYACWLKGYTDAMEKTDDVIYAGTSVLGFGSAVLVRGETKKQGFAEIDDETGELTGFSFYFEEDEGGDLVGIITEEGFIYRDEISCGTYILYDYITDEPGAYILALDGYGSGTLSYAAGDLIHSDFGFYEYDPETGDYVFVCADPITQQPLEPMQGFYFILEEEAIPEMENFKGFFIQRGDEHGNYILYDDGHLMDTAIYLDGYGGAALYTANGADEDLVRTDIGYYYGTENFENLSGEWEYYSSQTHSTFRFTINYVLNEDGSYIQIYVLFDETHSGTFNEKNGTGTLTLDGYGQAVYTSEGGTFEGVVVFGDTLCTFYVYDETYQIVDTLYFNIDWDNQEFSPNTDDFVIDDGVLIGYTGTSKNITIPDGVTEIAAEVFKDMDLVSVVIPASVTKIGANAFQNTYTLTRATFLGADPAAIDIDWAAANDPFRWPEGSFVIVVPEENVAAFRDAWTKAWTAAGRSATLYPIKGSEEVNKRPEFEVNAEGVLIAYNRPSDSSSTDLVISKGQTEYNGTDITITAIADNVFKGNTWLTSIDLGGVTEIGANAFYGCTALASVTFTNVATIGEAAFADCTALTGENGKITLPAIVTIGESAFSGCTGLKHITLGENIKDIQSKAFMEIATLEGSIFYLELTGGTPPTIAASAGLVSQGALYGNVAYRIIVPNIEYAKECWKTNNDVYGSRLMMEPGEEANTYYDGASSLVLNGRAELYPDLLIWLYEIKDGTITFYSAEAANKDYVAATGTYAKGSVTVTINGTEYHFRLSDGSVTFTSEDGLYTLVVDDPKELDPDTWSGSDKTNHSITVTFNGTEVTLTMKGYGKTIEDYADADGKHYKFEITLSASGNTFTYKKTALQSTGDLEFDANGKIEGLTCDDGSTLNLHKLGASVYVYGELKNVDGKALPSFSDYGTTCSSIEGNVVTFVRPYLSKEYTITATINMAEKTFTYTWSDGSTPTPAPTKYTVTVSGEGVTANGLATDGYEAGAKVTFTLTVADETKEIDSVTSAEVTIENNGNGEYTFTMPAKAVTITVTLKEKGGEEEPTTALYLPEKKFEEDRTGFSKQHISIEKFEIDWTTNTIHYWVTIDGAASDGTYVLETNRYAYSGTGEIDTYWTFYIKNGLTSYDYALAILKDGSAEICDASSDEPINGNLYRLSTGEEPEPTPGKTIDDYLGTWEGEDSAKNVGKIVIEKSGEGYTVSYANAEYLDELVSLTDVQISTDEEGHVVLTAKKDGGSPVLSWDLKMTFTADDTATVEIKGATSEFTLTGNTQPEPTPKPEKPEDADGTYTNPAGTPDLDEFYSYGLGYSNYTSVKLTGNSLLLIAEGESENATLTWNGNIGTGTSSYYGFGVKVVAEEGKLMITFSFNGKTCEVTYTKVTDPSGGEGGDGGDTGDTGDTGYTLDYFYNTTFGYATAEDAGCSTGIPGKAVVDDTASKTYYLYNATFKTTWDGKYYLVCGVIPTTAFSTTKSYYLKDDSGNAITDGTLATDSPFKIYDGSGTSANEIGTVTFSINEQGQKQITFTISGQTYTLTELPA